MQISVISNVFLLHQIRHYASKDALIGRKVSVISDSGNFEDTFCLFAVLASSVSRFYYFNYIYQRNGSHW